MAELLIYDDIGEAFEGITAKDVSKELDHMRLQPGERLDVRINSLGGAVGEGLTIRNLLRKFSAQQRATIRVIVDGYAYSAASIIAMSADKGELIMNTGSMMMVHRAWTLAYGNASEFRNLINYLEKLDKNLAEIYAARTGLAFERIMGLMEAETYMTAKEAVMMGFADQINEFAVANLSQFDVTSHALRAMKPGEYERFMCQRAEERARKRGSTLPTKARLALLDLETEILD